MQATSLNYPCLNTQKFFLDKCNCSSIIDYSLGDNYINSINKLIPSRIIFKVLLNKLIVNQSYKYLLNSFNVSKKRLGFVALVVRNLKIHKLKLYPNDTVFDFPVFLTAVNDCQFLKVLEYWQTRTKFEKTLKKSEDCDVKVPPSNLTERNDFSEDISFIDVHNQDIGVIFYSVKDLYSIIMLPSRKTLTKLKKNMTENVRDGIVLLNIVSESSCADIGFGIITVNPSVILPDFIVEVRDASKKLANEKILMKNAKELALVHDIPLSLATQHVFVDYHSCTGRAMYKYVAKKKNIICCCTRSTNICEKIP